MYDICVFNTLYFLSQCGSIQLWMMAIPAEINEVSDIPLITCILIGGCFFIKLSDFLSSRITSNATDLGTEKNKRRSFVP